MANNKNSGDPRKRAAQAPRAEQFQENLSPTPASQWQSTTGGGVIEDLRLPSGNVARVRRVGPEAFLSQGLLPDTLTPIVEKAIHNKKGLKPQQLSNISSDPKKLGALMEMLDRLLVYAVVEPKVQMPPGCSTCGELDTFSVAAHEDESSPEYHAFDQLPREPGILYADFIDLEDKIFIMNFAVGGTRDLERFRNESRAALAGVSSVQVN